MALNVLILYDDKSTFTNTVKEHLESFALFSQNNIYYSTGTQSALSSLDLSLFDVVIIHYSVRICYDWHISPFYAKALSEYRGFKVLFIQDEYDMTETARNWMEKLGIGAVFTCVPEQYIELVYPSFRFPSVEFIQTLTGWVPIYLEKNTQFKPLSERKYLIGYRGRPLPYWYGNLAREKLIIGQRMRQICEERGIASDIEWEEGKRIYGDSWYEFIGNCKALLGTESGSNVFDDYGHIRKDIQIALQDNPEITYEEVHAQYLAEHDGKVRMNQISPKIFEAIALKTALVLFEGSYSEIIQPYIHYIPLKKDFSNVDKVLRLLDDDRYLEELTERAYQDIINSGKYSYKNFIQEFDRLLDRCVASSRSSSPFFVQESIQTQLHNYYQVVLERQIVQLAKSEETINTLQSSNLELQQTINTLQSSNLELQQTINTLQSSNLELQQTINALQSSDLELQQTINALQSSKFFKLRKYWFRLKRFLGLCPT
ncbi:MAG: hypothetical protein Fur006_01010 [Coleofasciculaceae cyanobacterium]